MANVYLLWPTHTFADGDDDGGKLIGVYESVEAANAAQLRVAGQPGFISNPEGFEISEYAVNKDHWRDGYVVPNA